MIIEFNKILAVFSVGTALMPSGDSSLRIKMNPGSKCAETVHGDESPDAINRVPTEKKRTSFIKEHNPNALEAGLD